MNSTGPQPAAWAAVLPPGAGWLAATAPPWSLAASRHRADPDGPRCYVSVPSERAPLLIASRDPAVLRYVARSVLSVPPGAGPLASMVLTGGLGLLRFRLVAVVEVTTTS